jgi:hypothetical protein
MVCNVSLSSSVVLREISSPWSFKLAKEFQKRTFSNNPDDVLSSRTKQKLKDQGLLISRKTTDVKLLREFGPTFDALEKGIQAAGFICHDTPTPVVLQIIEIFPAVAPAGAVTRAELAKEFQKRTFSNNPDDVLSSRTKQKLKDQGHDTPTPVVLQIIEIFPAVAPAGAVTAFSQSLASVLPFGGGSRPCHLEAVECQLSVKRRMRC